MQRPISPALEPSIEYDSSPDPLAHSVGSRSTQRSDGGRNRRLTSPRKTPLREISANAQIPPQSPPTRSLLPPNSPVKAITEQTLSPWKIRVTVEAEPENGQGEAHMSTRTYQIPLKPCSSPSEGAASRGRTKKVAQSSPARKKRSGTPVRGGNRRKSVTDLNITVLGDDEDENEWSPRKKAAAKRKSRRSSPAKSSLARQTTPEYHEVENMYPEPEEHAEPEMPTEDLRELDLNRVSVRTRSASIRQKQTQQPADSGELHSSEVKTNQTKRRRDFSNLSTRSYPTPSPTPSAPGEEHHEDLAQDCDMAEGFDTILESEGFTMIDLDSIPSARRVFSSPSETDTGGKQTSVLESQEGKQVGSLYEKETDGSGSKPEGDGYSAREAYDQTKLQPSVTVTPEADETELSSNVASSPPTMSNFLELPKRSNLVRKVTPDVYSSPKLPSPPKHHRKEDSPVEDIVPPKRVVCAGQALQGALSSPACGPKHTWQETPSSSQDDFLDGFSSGTKRELRAGLRFGEELAKRQSPAISSDNKGVPKQPHERLRHNTQTWRGETVVQRSPLLTDVSMQTKNGLTEKPRTTRQLSKSPLSQVQPEHFEGLLKTTATATPEAQRRESPQIEYPTLDRRQEQREHEWQLEREAVSRQINEASPSKVIVIDSSSIEGTPESTVRREANGRQDSSTLSEKPGSGRSLGQKTREVLENPRDELQAGEVLEQERASTAGGLQRDSDSYQGGAESSVEDAPTGGSPADLGEHDSRWSDDEDQTDVWLAQALFSSNSSQPTVTTSKTPDLPQRKQGQARGPAMEPRRSVIPSPWKRGENVEESTMLTNGDASGIIWQKPIGTRFGATELALQSRKVSNGKFDVDRMRSSPTRLACPGHKKMILRKTEDESSSFCGDSTDITNTDFSDSAVQYSMRSTPIQPVKIPVKFNDSTLSIDAITPSSTRSPHEEEADNQPAPCNATMSEVKSSRRSSPPERIVIPAASDPKARTFNGDTPPSTEARYYQHDHGYQPSQPHMAPVVFNEPNTIITPPSTKSSRTENEESRPPTPRSALKGGRISAGLEDPGMSPTKRVVFNQRSRYLNENGDESTMSANFDSPAPLNAMQVEQPLEHQHKPTEDAAPEIKAGIKTDSWFSWLLRGKSPSPAELKLESQSADAEAVWPQVEPAPPSTAQYPGSDLSALVSTLPTTTPSSRSNKAGPAQDLQSNIASAPELSPPHEQQAYIRPPKLPSYLQAPSYPTIPTRFVSSPLPVAGDFTNTHFRTLHILHAKSRYAGFHTPKHIRREIQELRGMVVSVDETDFGSDVFEWQLGFTECAVLERFCQEIEWGWTCDSLGHDVVEARLQEAAINAAIRREKGKKNGDQSRAVKVLAKMSRPENKAEIKKYWDALECEGRDVWTREMRKVEWGWSVEQLANWLGRIVIGAVVREEEKAEELSRVKRDEGRSVELEDVSDQWPRHHGEQKPKREARRGKKEKGAGFGKGGEEA